MSKTSSCRKTLKLLLRTVILIQESIQKGILIRKVIKRMKKRNRILMDQSLLKLISISILVFQYQKSKVYRSQYPKESV